MRADRRDADHRENDQDNQQKQPPGAPPSNYVYLLFHGTQTTHAGGATHDYWINETERPVVENFGLHM